MQKAHGQFGAGFGAFGGFGMGGFGGGGCMIPMQCYGMPPMMGGGMGGLGGMFGGALSGFSNMYCPQRFYASGMGFGPGGTPWYTEGCPQQPMMNIGMPGCMAPWYCQGMPFPQPRQRVVRTRSCEKYRCERTPGGGLGPPRSETPTIIQDPVVVKPPPRPFVPPPQPPKPEPQLITEEPPILDPGPITFPPVEIPPIIGGPPPAQPMPEPAKPTPGIPSNSEVGIVSANPSDRCLARRKRYEKSKSKNKTVGTSCPPEGCAEAKGSGAADVARKASRKLTPARGIDIYLASVYQDCSVLEKDNIICGRGNTFGKNQDGISFSTSADGGIARIVSAAGAELKHEWLNEICTDTKFNDRAPQCKKVCEAPPIFNWGGKPTLTIEDGRAVLNTNTRGSGGANKIQIGNRKPVLMDSGHDCAGLHSGSHLPDGRPMIPVTSTNELLKMGSIGKVAADQPVHMTPRSLITAGEPGRNTCFTTVTLDHDSPLLPGDTISRAAHTMLIDRIDEGWEGDPFGLACWGQELDVEGKCEKPLGKDEIKKSTFDCRKASPVYFRFDIAQSAGGADSSGPSRTPASDLFAVVCLDKGVPMVDCKRKAGGSDTLTGNALTELAIKHCESVKSGEKKGPKAIATNKSLGIVRHLGRDKPGCKFDEPKIKNSECIQQCLGSL